MLMRTRADAKGREHARGHDGRRRRRRRLRREVPDDVDGVATPEGGEALLRGDAGEAVDDARVARHLRRNRAHSKGGLIFPPACLRMQSCAAGRRMGARLRRGAARWWRRRIATHLARDDLRVGVLGLDQQLDALDRRSRSLGDSARHAACAEVNEELRHAALLGGRRRHKLAAAGGKVLAAGTGRRGHSSDVGHCATCTPCEGGLGVRERGAGGGGEPGEVDHMARRTDVIYARNRSKHASGRGQAKRIRRRGGIATCRDRANLARPATRPDCTRA